MNSNDTSREHDLDKILQSAVPVPQPDPWLVRQTLNRLPDKSTRLFSIPERIAYLLTLILQIALWIVLFRSMPTGEDMIMNIMIYCMALSLVGLLWMGSIFSRALRTC